MAGAPRDEIAVACALIALTLGAAPAHADARQDERCTREDAQSAAAPEIDGIEAEAMHALPTVTLDAHPLPPLEHRGIWPPGFVAHFVDHFDLAARLRAIKHLRIVPVFDNARLTVFFGIDRHGVAGLHFQQQDAADLPPLLAHEAPFADVPPLRAAPLRSP
jgi:hypothetical protein